MIIIPGNCKLIYMQQLLIFSSMINFPILLGLRISEIFLLCTNFIFFKKKQILILLIVLIALLINTTYGIIQNSNFETERLIFIFKYAVPFIALFHGVNAKSSYVVELMILFVTLLALWTLIYPVLLLQGTIVGSWRPSFPSSDYSYSDAHMLSAVLATVLSFTLINKNRRFKLNTIITKMCVLVYLAIVLLAILVTGSRNGVLILVLTFLYICMFDLKIRFFVLVMIIFFTVLGLFIEFEMIVNLVGGFRRIFDFDFANDASISGRFLKIERGVDETISDNVLFGRSILHGNLIWYDNGPVILFVHFGLIALLVFLVGCLFFLYWVFATKKLSRSKTNIVFFATVLLVTSGITEFFLATRYAVPVFYCFGVLIRDYRK